MSDYKSTLHLPQTDFPMKASLPNREPTRCEQWAEQDLYATIRTKRAGQPTYILHDGPPYASGRPHMGTAMNKVIKDMIVKAKTLSGFDAPFVPGWDCHGLPIELNVEKKHGKPGTKLNEREFRDECRRFAQSQVDIQSEDFQRLGVMADWQNPYITMDRSFEADTIRALSKIVERGHLVRGFKPVHWCVACRSALAEAEVIYQDKQSPAIDVGFAVSDKAAFEQRFSVTLNDQPLWVPIWTTTPWTIPANVAVCMHPEILYSLVALSTGAYVIVATELVESVAERYGAQVDERLGEWTGSQLQGLLLKHPLEERNVPIILGDHVTTDAGTGNVHTAPSHGVDDYRVCQAAGIVGQSHIDGRGVFVDSYTEIEGLPIKQANPVLVEMMREKGTLLHDTVLEHSYPHCWRHKAPLMFRATPQWFIGMDKAGLRKQAMDAIKGSSWVPSWGEARIQGMVEGRPDWCISRQRVWGIPIAVLVHGQTGDLHPDTQNIMEKAAQLVEKDGIDAWYDAPINAFTEQSIEGYEKVTDVLDVWFDSGVTHACVLDKREALSRPADLYFEGTDQHRGWFQSSLLTSVAMTGKAPYRTVLTHGYVVDGKGRKMSKSLGNGMYPADVVKQLGADVLRLWAAATDHTGDMSVSQDILKRSADAYRRMRNTARFLLGNLCDFDASDAVSWESMTSLDRWACEQTKAMQEALREAYDTFQLPKIYQLLHNYCSVTLGGFYLDVIKDRLYTCAKQSVARRSAQTALHHILQALVRWLAPILSFTAEEIWQHMSDRDEESVFLTHWYTGLDAMPKASDDVGWDVLLQVRDEVNKALEEARNNKTIGGALEANVTVHASAAVYDQLARLGDELRFLLLTSAATLAQDDALDQGCRVEIAIASGEKCERCWQRREDVGAHAEHATLCGRCVTNLGEGEQRACC